MNLKKTQFVRYRLKRLDYTNRKETIMKNTIWISDNAKKHLNDCTQYEISYIAYQIKCGHSIGEYGGFVDDMGDVYICLNDETGNVEEWEKMNIA